MLCRLTGLDRSTFCTTNHIASNRPRREKCFQGSRTIPTAGVVLAINGLLRHTATKTRQNENVRPITSKQGFVLTGRHRGRYALYKCTSSYYLECYGEARNIQTSQPCQRQRRWATRLQTLINERYQTPTSTCDMRRRRSAVTDQLNGLGPWLSQHPSNYTPGKPV